MHRSRTIRAGVKRKKGHRPAAERGVHPGRGEFFEKLQKWQRVSAAEMSEKKAPSPAIAPNPDKDADHMRIQSTIRFADDDG